MDRDDFYEAGTPAYTAAWLLVWYLVEVEGSLSPARFNVGAELIDFLERRPLFLRQRLCMQRGHHSHQQERNRRGQHLTDFLHGIHSSLASSRPWCPKYHEVK